MSRLLEVRYRTETTNSRKGFAIISTIPLYVLLKTATFSRYLLLKLSRFPLSTTFSSIVEIQIIIHPFFFLGALSFLFNVVLYLRFFLTDFSSFGILFTY